MTFSLDLTVPLTRDIEARLPAAVCELQPNNGTTNLIINNKAAPFNDPKLRLALSLALDRVAFISILSQGKGLIGAAMLPPPDGS